MVVKYTQALNSGANDQSRRVLEGQLSWLVNAVGAIIGGHYNTSSRPSLHPTMVYGYSAVSMRQQMQPGDELVDADLSKCVLQLVEVLNQKHLTRTPTLSITID